MYSYVRVCTRMNSLVCYTYVVLVTIVRKSMVIELPVYISFLKEKCLRAQIQREEK